MVLTACTFHIAVLFSGEKTMNVNDSCCLAVATLHGNEIYPYRKGLGTQVIDMTRVSTKGMVEILGNE